MKRAIIQLGLSFLVAALSCSCGNGQPNEVKKAERIQSAIQATRPGTIPTTENAWMMKAKINGKNWVASSMMPPEAARRIIGYYNNESIALPYDRRYFVVGKKITFGEDNGTDLVTNDDVGMWAGTKGEMEITKVDDDWAEGTFFFRGSSSRSEKTIEVKDGFFRISLTRSQ